jgi:hypothetical protein
MLLSFSGPGPGPVSTRIDAHVDMLEYRIQCGTEAGDRYSASTRT